jgi:hypothetical protein
VLAVLGLLFPVALGGATVFGVYFLFLKDLLDQPAPPVKAEQPAGIVKDSPAPHRDSLSEPRRSVIVNPPAVVSDSPPKPPKPPSEPVKTPAEIQAERETAAKKALGLARQMSAQNPRAAEKWYRKVLVDFPGTRAADEAQDWLRKQAD